MDIIAHDFNALSDDSSVPRRDLLSTRGAENVIPNRM